MPMLKESELFLKVLGAIWFFYGTWCFFYPLYTVEKFFGLKLAKDAHWGVSPEIAAMYGGAQMGVGMIGLYAALFDKANKGGAIASLRSFVFVMGMLGVLRLIAVLREGHSIITVAVYSGGVFDKSSNPSPK
eukprot:Hpha_TRINITY_DN8475_c0_g1::TRINITY_DN8475_c0_g1_i3::g.34583::m.34583